MASLNSVVLLGNLTRDPEIKYLPSGSAVTSFGLAVNRRYRQGDDWRVDVCFVDIVVFGRQAETSSEYLSKGSLVTIEGRLQFRQWETQDGQRRSKHEVIANNIQFMPRGQPGESSSAYRSRHSPVSSFDPTPEYSEPTGAAGTARGGSAPMAWQGGKPQPSPGSPSNPSTGNQGAMFGDDATGYGDNDDIPF